MSALTSGPLRNMAGDHFDWHRRSLKERVVRFFSFLTVGIVLVWTLGTIDVFWPWVWSAPEEIQDMFSRMMPPNYRTIPEIVPVLIETINIATIGTIFAVVISLPVAYLGARNVSPNKATLAVARVIIVASRSINTLIWALLFVAILGPGPLAGVLSDRLSLYRIHG